MNHQQLYSSLKKQNKTKIVLMVADGLGGIPQTPGGKTELETASTPNLDKLAHDYSCGLTIPVLPGITPGSGPGHLGLFGYDPLEIEIGRGVLESLGIDFDLQPNDIAARANFCSVDEQGNITDRRAGRIPTEKCAELVEKLRAIKIANAEIILEPVQDYRFVLVIRGQNLGADVTTTDPQVTGVPALEAKSLNAESQPTADIVNEFVKQAKEILKNDHPANMMTFRGFGKKPKIPTMEELFGVKPAAVAVYPMYRGLARLVGMNVLPKPQDLQAQIAQLQNEWNNYDFFFVHYKYTDSRGEDGNFAEKVKHIETIDAAIPQILALNPDVFIFTGDHSTPAAMAAHSWHPVPTVLMSKFARPSFVEKFGETNCLTGSLGTIKAKYLLPFALANAERLEKFGA